MLIRRPSQRVFDAAQCDPRLRAGLVAHYVGGGSGATWFDRSGNGYHGAITGAAWTLGEGGKRNALTFDGTDDFVLIGGLGATPTLYTIAFWGKHNTIAGGIGFDTVLSLSAPYGASVWVYPTGDVSCGDAGGSWATKAGIWADTTSFHHIACVIESSGTVRFYVDGVDKGTATGTTTGTWSSARIGEFATLLNNFNQFNGILDDVRIYNRALSGAEIATLASPSFVPILPGVARVAVEGTATPIVLEGTASLAITTAAALTTSIRLAATPSVAITTAGVLSTGIPLAATSTVSISSAGVLSTGIPLAGTSTISVATAGVLSTGISLAAAGTISVTTAGALTTDIPLAATASISVSTAGVLSTGIPLAGASTISVTTAGVLSTGISLAAAGTISVTSAGAFTTGIPLAGTASASISTSAALTTGIPLASAASVAITGAGVLSTDIRLAAAASVAITTAGALSTGIPLAGSATISIDATARFFTEIVGTAAISVSTAGVLTTSIQLAGASTVAITTAAVLSTSIRLAGAATISITATAPYVVLPRQRVLGRNVRANHHPFTGRGASLYAGVGPSDGSDPGPESVVFRKLRTLGGNIVKGSSWSIADGIIKTARIAHVVDPDTQFTYPVPEAWAGRIVYLQVRTHWSDCETVINPDPVRLDFTDLGAVDPTIHGTGTILAADKYDGGTYRVRTRYNKATHGTQPTILLLRKTAGTGTLADVFLDYDSDKIDYAFTTAALVDAAAYTFALIAQNGLIEQELDTIIFTADAAGPPEVTGLTLTLI